MGANVGRTLGLVATADAAVQAGCFAVAAALQTEKFYDISGSATYILCVLLSLRQGKAGPRQLVNSSLVVTWAARLGSFLFWRVIQDGKDRRFDNVRNHPKRFAEFWAIQALWVFLTASPLYILNSKQEERSGKTQPSESLDKKQAELAPPLGRLGWRDAAGWGMWALGFVVQVIADTQKTAFRANPANDGRWIDVGLWRLAQHPNYFGEICMWWGIFLSCSSELRGAELASGASPFLVSYLLLRVSGVPLLRRAGLKRWGHLPEYREYLRKTPLLLPLPQLP